MNFAPLVCIGFSMIFLFCGATDKEFTQYRSIPFNREVIGSLFVIKYMTDNKVMLGGNRGIVIQNRDQKDINTIKIPPHMWFLSHDDQKIAFFNSIEIFIEDLYNKAPGKKICMQERLVQGVAVDSTKNIIFIAHSHYGTGIRKYHYDTDLYQDISKGDNYCYASMDLSQKKDILCLLDASQNIFLHRTADLGLLKKIKLTSECPYYSCVFNPHHDNLIVSGQQSICVISDLHNKCKTDYIALKDSSRWVKSIAFHPLGLVAILLSTSFSPSALIQYWDTILLKEVDRVEFSAESVQNLCFSPNGLELAIATTDECRIMPVSLQVVNQYIAPKLWMKLKTIQEQFNIPQDIIKHCIHTFIAYTQI